MNKKTFVADGRSYQKGSRWIKVQNGEVKNKNHSLYDYKEDDNSITYFTHSGIKYAISQFMMLKFPIIIENVAIIGGYDIECSYKPYLLEIEEGCEYVRLWEEVSDI